MNEEKTYEWKSPVSFNSRSMAKVTEECLQELAYKFEREDGRRHYTRFMMVMPLPQMAYVFRFVLTSPCNVEIEYYDTRPTHASTITYMEIKGLTEGNIGHVKRLLFKVVEKLPREPWKFTIGQRLQHGYFMPEFRRAKKAWESIGVKSKGRAQRTLLI